MSAIASWKTRENCVDCGFPCRRDGCRHYPAGVLLKCDRCGDEWAVNPGSIEAEGDEHYCKICRREIERERQNLGAEKKLKKGVDKPNRLVYITPQQSHHRGGEGKQQQNGEQNEHGNRNSKPRLLHNR